jgi:hypothetical protein
VPNALVEASEKGRRFFRNDGTLNVCTSKRANGFDRLPVRDDDNFDSVGQWPIENGHAAITVDALQLRDDVRSQML